MTDLLKLQLKFFFEKPNFKPRCPKCGRKGLEWKDFSRQWRCLFSECGFSDREFPSPAEIEELKRLTKSIRLLQELKII